MVSLHDFMLRQMIDGELMRYDIIVRLLAVENYFQKNDFGFDMYRKMQEMRIGKEKVEEAVANFKILLESYEKSGYDNQYPILVDNSLNLVDGSHRIALALYSNEEWLRLMTYNVEYPVDYSRDWFVLNGFSEEWINIITEKAKSIEKKFMDTRITCIIWPPACQQIDKIERMIQYFADIEKKEFFSYNEAEFENLIRLVYSIDDILPWKIDKKLEYIKKNQCGDSYDVIYMTIKMSNPRYRLKYKKHTPLSIMGERIKKTIRNTIKNDVKEYFYDIILHTSDNDLQEKFIERCFDPEIDVNEILKAIHSYKYVLVKTEVPYMPRKFPERIPIGKDLDILVSKCDYDEVVDIIRSIASKYKYFDYKELQRKGNTRIRLEKFGHLFYQFDIGQEFEGITDNFIEDVISSRVRKDNYYVPTVQMEMVIREAAYKNNNGKKWHKDFIEMHKEFYDRALIEKYMI